ncbi:MAG TPA: ABC transporter permease [Acidobacteriota bacterium]|nr:ABC transporter permease [Acidobacteriota bacterium]
MNGVLAIIRKELSHYFFAPMAYIVMGSFLLMNGFVFYVILAAVSRAGSAGASPMAIMFGGTFFFWLITIIMIPVITMKLGAEERKQGTIETLLTAPLSDLEIVLGKFSAAFVFYFLCWLLTFVYVLVLRAYGEIDWGPVLSGYLGTLLLGMFFISIGMFTTMISKNQIVAAIFALAILTMLMGSTLFTFIMSRTGREIFAYADLLGVMENFARGVIDTRNLVYLLSGTCLFVALSVKALEAKRWQ